jgi:formylglycine-generating enzyme required for sulfatase activity
MDADQEEQPQHRLYLPDYFLAKTPVTNAQYAAFVQATGHPAPFYWINSAPPRSKEHHPVDRVSWYDARDYCQWLSDVTGRSYAMPSEAEWEKGARGTDGRIYPWGNSWDATHCNSYASGLRQTTSVDAYPQGASPYGVLDMAGNVCEWTRSLATRSARGEEYSYPYRATDGRENMEAGRKLWRVLRGGAFDDVFRLVRCAYRLSRLPDLWVYGIGFRVVMHPAS